MPVITTFTYNTLIAKMINFSFLSSAYSPESEADVQNA
jgi:hypothetical protein